MNNCLNCGKEIVQKDFGKPRKFCDNNNSCKQAYHNKNKKEKRFVRFDSFQALKEKFDMVVAENMELKSAKIEKVDNKPIAKFVLDVEDNPMPIRMKGEDAFEFSARKNEWKKSQLK